MPNSSAHTLIIGGLAGESISAYRVVVFLNGKIYNADPTNFAHSQCKMAVAQSAVNIGGLGQVVGAGELNRSFLTPGSRFFVGAGGALSTAPTFDGAMWSRQVGYCERSDVLMVELGPVIIR